MRAVVLSSGSKGNTTYIEYLDTKILIDIGNSCKYVSDKLESIGVKAKDIDAILITHTHVDHIKGLKVFEKKYGTNIYMTNKMRDELDYVNNYTYIDNSVINIKDIKINVIKTSHDVASSLGYVIEGDNRSIVYITDTGYINNKYFNLLENRDVYIMESNHDIEMLNNGPYSFQLRQRILGDKGHLSNYDSARYLSSFIGDKTKVIVLAHLSEENNTYDLAYNTLLDRLNDNKQEVGKVIIAKQNIPTEEIVI